MKIETRREELEDKEVGLVWSSCVRGDYLVRTCKEAERARESETDRQTQIDRLLGLEADELSCT